MESKRCAGGKVVQRNVLYLGEINDSQRAAWCDLIEAFDEGAQRHTQLVLFPADRPLPEHALAYGMQVRLDAMELHRPRQWVHADWRVSCMSNSNLIDSGPAAWRFRAKGHGGRTFCRRWCAIA